MAAKVLASLTTLVGAISVLYALLAAFGIEFTKNQQDALTGSLGLVLVLAGIWLHPSIPVGPHEEKE